MTIRRDNGGKIYIKLGGYEKLRICERTVTILK